MAFKHGITVEAYANIENGRFEINTSKLYLISLILGVKASKIIESAENQETK
ncbi:helix-turn-helix domain-containing protein [Pedobacter sp. AW1-32]|uniref:helix-turn-helix domain-containing protein n=1 Tax=Pedobacter sp. AW1-32 TaxID=3383026 RepID=UPI003FF05E1E